MKLVRTVTMTAALAMLAGTAAFAGSGEGKEKGPRGGHGPAMDHLLPKHVVEDLNLTADQKTKLDELDSAFKKDAADWEKAHPNFKDDMRKAHDSGDKDAIHKVMQERKPLMETRKGYVDKLRSSLTDEQKSKLDKALDEGRKRSGKGPRGDKPGED